MLGWARRLPAYALNGVSVSLGVGLVQLLSSTLVSAAHAQAASTGAVLASLPHLTGRALPTLRRTLSGGLLASLVTWVVMASFGHPWLRALLIGLVSLLALLGMGWGARAAPIVFSVIIGMIFSLAQPGDSPAWQIALASACGAAGYASWAFANARLLEPRYRTLAVFSSLEAAAALLRARAAVLSEPPHPDEDAAAEARFGQLKDEVKLAQVLQNARDLVYPAAQKRGGAIQVALLSRVAELREIVLTSRLDLDLLGGDHAARFVRARLALGLRHLARALSRLAELGARGESEAAEHALPPLELPDLLEAASLLEAQDPRARLLPLVAARLRYLQEEVEAMRALISGDMARASLRPEPLERYVADDDTWPLSALSSHLTLDSPVLRHALRSSLAFTSVYAFAYALPWAARPYWMLLSVAVVLRGTLDDTLSRRNLRVLGTALGCLLVTALVAVVPELGLKLAFVAGVGVAHAFVNVRYLLTAIAGTVMALLQAHFAISSGAPLVVERLLDTVIGALFAWAFSYVLPSWERRTLPAAIVRALDALRAYSASALELHAARADQRLLRQRAYDALEVVAGALRRSAAEPRRVRPPVKDLVLALDHAQRLMAHLSSLRSLLRRRSQRLPTGDANEALARASTIVDEQLSLLPPRERRAPSASYSELPGTAVEQEPLPWLLRRLDASIHDATQAGIAIRRAFEQLDVTS